LPVAASHSLLKLFFSIIALLYVDIEKQVLTCVIIYCETVKYIVDSHVRSKLVYIVDG
jgi:hypothetical protein